MKLLSYIYISLAWSKSFFLNNGYKLKKITLSDVSLDFWKRHYLYPARLNYTRLLMPMGCLTLSHYPNFPWSHELLSKKLYANVMVKLPLSVFIRVANSQSFNNIPTTDICDCTVTDFRVHEAHLLYTNLPMEPWTVANIYTGMCVFSPASSLPGS